MALRIGESNGPAGACMALLQSEAPVRTPSKPALDKHNAD